MPVPLGMHVDAVKDDQGDGALGRCTLVVPDTGITQALSATAHCEHHLL